MELDTHLQVWRELKPHLIGGDVDAAAEDFIRVLVEHGFNADDIAQYACDTALSVALQDYIEADVIDDDNEYEEDDHEYED